MRSFAARSHEPEMMDGADVTTADFAACMADLARVNTVTLARPPTLAWLARATRDWPKGSSFTLLDVGYGQGDMLRAIDAWARRRGLQPQLVGMDLNPRSEPAARAATKPSVAIDYRTGDVFTESLGSRMDFIVSSLVTHHMADEEIVRFLRWMEAEARRGWFINDLHRHPVAFYGFKLLAWAARWHRFVQHDGPVSVARSFRRSDWERLLAAAGIDRSCVALRWRLPFRFCLGRVR